MATTHVTVLLPYQMSKFRAMMEHRLPDTGLDGLNHLQVGEGNIRFVSARSQPDVRSILRDADRHDLVICHRGAGLSLGLLAKLVRRATVIVYHIEIYEMFRVKSLRGALLSAFDEVVFPTTVQARLARTWYRLESRKVAHLPWGVDVTFFSAEGRDSVDDRLVLAVGQANRDYTTLVSAVRKANMKLLIAHEGPWSLRTEPARIELARLRGDNLVVGTFSLTQLVEFYKSAGVVVTPLHPTVSGAGFTSLFQGFAMEKPSIVTRSPGLADFVRHRENCLLVEPNDTVGMVDALNELSGNKSLGAFLARNGRRLAREVFNTRASGLRLSDHIRHLIA